MDNIIRFPNNLTKPEELKDALLHTVSAYMDYRHYHVQMLGMLDHFDETLEHSDFAAWLRLSTDPEGIDDLTANTIDAMNTSVGLLEQVEQRAWKNLSMVIRAVLTSPPNIQKLVWNEVYNVPEEEQTVLLEKLLDFIMELEYEYAIEAALTAFLTYFHEFMKQTEE